MRAALLVALLAASGASAQPVTLRLWHVPADARVCGTTTLDVATRLATPDSVSAFSGTFSSRVCWSAFETRDGRLVAAREVLTHVGAADTTDAVDDPLLGDTLQLASQHGGAWTARLLHGAPTEDQQGVLGPPFAFDLDDQYLPDTPVSVGDTWEVPASTLVRSVGPLRPGAPFHYTVRLDSLGERAGRRVAFLTHEATFSPDAPGRADLAHKTRVAAIDLETGVETWAAQTFDRQFELETTDAHGKRAVARVKISRRTEVVRTVEGFTRP